MPEDKFVLLKLEDESVDIIYEVNLEIRKGVWQEDKKNVISLR